MTSQTKARRRLGALLTCSALLSVLLAETAAAQPKPMPATQLAPADWELRLSHARVQLVLDKDCEAATELRELASLSTNVIDRARAQELISLAQLRCKHRGASDQPALRTSDELTVLYTIAVLYGLGTSTWLALQLRPNNFGTALLPFVIATPASIIAVALADGYKPLRHGIPHAIAAGLYLGLGEGVWLTGYQNAYAVHHGTARWSAERVSSALWVATSVGALAGGLVGAWRRPTPGRVSFTASAAIWSGVLSAFATSAVVRDHNERSQDAFVIGSMGYNAGLVAGLLFGPSIAPSITRVRLTDLGGLFGGLAFVGGYELLASQRHTRVALGAAAVGSALGLGLTWLLTSGMPADRSHDALPPAIGQRRSPGVTGLQPMLAPVPGGVLAGVAGELQL